MRIFYLLLYGSFIHNLINMDIIITGAQATGKTTAAHKLLAERFGVNDVYKTPVSQLLILEALICKRVDLIRETIRAARVEAVLFDTCLLNAHELLMAIQAVKEAREQLGRDLFVVYVTQSNDPLHIVKHPNNINIKDYAKI